MGRTIKMAKGVVIQCAALSCAAGETHPPSAFRFVSTLPLFRFLLPFDPGDTHNVYPQLPLRFLADVPNISLC